MGIVENPIVQRAVAAAPPDVPDLTRRSGQAFGQTPGTVDDSRRAG
jgi:hypothetical protein